MNIIIDLWMKEESSFTLNENVYKPNYRQHSNGSLFIEYSKNGSDNKNNHIHIFKHRTIGALKWQLTCRDPERRIIPRQGHEPKKFAAFIPNQEYIEDMSVKGMEIVGVLGRPLINYFSEILKECIVSWENKKTGKSIDHTTLEWFDKPKSKVSTRVGLNERLGFTSLQGQEKLRSEQGLTQDQVYDDLEGITGFTKGEIEQIQEMLGGKKRTKRKKRKKSKKKVKKRSKSRRTNK